MGVTSPKAAPEARPRSASCDDDPEPARAPCSFFTLAVRRMDDEAAVAAVIEEDASDTVKEDVVCCSCMVNVSTFSFRDVVRLVVSVVEVLR